MKLVLVAYTEAIDDALMDVCTEAGAETYTKWTKVLGVGGASGPHLASHIWPKANNVIAICVDDAVATELMKGIRRLREKFRHEGVKAFVLPVDEVT